VRSILLAAVSAISLSVVNAAAQQAPSPPQNPWRGCCGGEPWSVGPGRMGPGMMGPRGGGIPRHHYARMSGIPAPYTSMTNPLPKTKETVQRGADVYEKSCASCHGATGQGDGAEGLKLSPRPGNLAWLSQKPMAQWDPFMYWTIVEGGAQFKTEMPAYKGKLSEHEIWAVTAYIQAHLPEKSKSK